MVGKRGEQNYVKFYLLNQILNIEANLYLGQELKLGYIGDSEFSDFGHEMSNNYFFNFFVF